MLNRLQNHRRCCGGGQRIKRRAHQMRGGGSDSVCRCDSRSQQRRVALEVRVVSAANLAVRQKKRGLILRHSSLLSSRHRRVQLWQG